MFEESEEQLIDIYDVKVNYFNISVVSKKKYNLLHICVIYIIIIDLNWGLHIFDLKNKKLIYFWKLKNFF